MLPTLPGDAAYALLKEFEQDPQGGFAPTPYPDSAGHNTIGWGHKLLPGDHFPRPLSAEQAEDLLVADLLKTAAAVAARVKVRLNQCMFDALCSLVFNIGVGAFTTSTLLAQLTAGAYAAAAEQFLRWDKARHPKTGRKEPLAGLTRRREVERALFLRDGMPA
jgi:lysozyme